MNLSSSKKLYVGSLPYSVTEDQLKDLFAAFGKVKSVKIVIDRFTGRSKGFGFVEMDTDDEAKKAIQEVHGKEYNGRTLIVSPANPESSNKRDDKRGFSRGPRRF